MKTKLCKNKNILFVDTNNKHLIFFAILHDTLAKKKEYFKFKFRCIFAYKKKLTT